MNKGALAMKRHTITELSDCWIIDGVVEIKKQPKPIKNKSWLKDFIFDLLFFKNNEQKRKEL